MTAKFEPTKGDTAPLAYRIPEACRIVGLSRTSIYKMITAGTLRSRKVAGVRLILRDDLLNVLGLK
jgi:excisionase family DNA binding protein